MADYAGLKAEIAKPAYARMTDAQIVTALEAPTTSTVDVPTSAVEGYLLAHLLMGKLQAFANGPPSGADPTLVAGIGALLEMVLSPHVPKVLMTNPDVSAAVTATLAGSVAATLISAQNQTDLLALSQVSTTIAQTYGFDPAIHDMSQEILAARRWE